MARVCALIIGVSKHTTIHANDLAFCKNDIYAMQQAFTQGLNVEPSDITLCGTSDTVSMADLIAALHQLSETSEIDDTLLVYFSGHGMTKDNIHYLVLSDKLVQTNELIGYLESNKAKNKVLFLDCCLAGNFKVDGTAIFNVDETADTFAGKGYAVIASCNAQQCSYGHPDKPISLFTKFLCDALSVKSIIREGKKSLHDIRKLVFMLLEGWNKHNPSKIQNPIYRANLGGTIYFDVQDYKPYITKQFFADRDSYIIRSVEPTHSGIAKRYSVRVILKQPMSFSEIAVLNHEIVQEVRSLNIYSNEMQEKRWKNTPANIIFCYFGLDETDILNNNYICHTTWADDTQDKNWWYRLDKNCEVINDIHFNIGTYYQSLKSFTEEHTAEREQLISDTKTIISRMVTLAEQLISIYNEFLNESKSEDDFRNEISEISGELTKLYFAETGLDIPPNDLKEWCQCCSGLAGTIHDLTLYYGHNKFEERTPENRKACMDMSIKQYYRDLEKLKTVEIPAGVSE